MTLVGVDTNQVRMQTGLPGAVPSKGASFANLMSAMAPAAATAVGVSGAHPAAAQMTHAALSSASVAAQPYSNTYMGASSPFSSGGYGVPDALGAGYSGGVYAGGGYAGGGAGASGIPTDPIMAQDYLMTKMRDQNMQMIQLQSTIQAESRRFQTTSNILKSKYDMEINSVRNMRTG